MKATPKPATPLFDMINPQHCVNAKVRKLHRLLNGMYMENYKPFGLQGSMVPILFIIGKKGLVNQKTLADLLILDQSTMSRDVKKLAGKGWIKIQKGEDPRHSELSITKKGYELLEQIAPVWQELHTKMTSLLGSFSLQQLDHISQAVQQMKKEK